MKRNLLKVSSALVLLVTATGCLEKAAEEAPSSNNAVVVNPRIALVEALDNQATKLINGINKVIITGNFVKNMAVENPPKEIPLETDQDIEKAINYIFSNQSDLGQATSYKPDPRLCSELIAKEHPAVCMEMMKGMTLIQTQINSTDGILEVNYAGAKPFVLTYSPSEVSLSTSFDEIVKVIAEVNRLKILVGEEKWLESLPAVHKGSLRASVSSQMLSSQISLSITSAIDLQGLDDSGKAYSFQIAASQNMILASLNSALGLGSLSVNLPQATIGLMAHDHQEQTHPAVIRFPGLSGAAYLDNSLAKVAVQALKLAAADVSLEIDGQQAVYATLVGEVNAEVQSSQGGNAVISFLQGVTGQLSVASNPIIEAEGELLVQIAQNTQVYFPHAFEQAKILQGSVQVNGTLDFAMSINATANMCIEGKQDSDIIQVAACQF